MTLIPVEHLRRLASPGEAEAFYRGLRVRRVGVRGFHTRDPGRIEALVAAAEPKREHTISFRDGALEGAARPALVELCGCAFDYFDLACSGASLRVWPGRRSWVTRLPRRTDADFQETKTSAEALDRLGRLGAETIVRGHISGITVPSRASLVRFLLAAGAEVHATLDVALPTARALTERFPGQELDWQAEMVLVDFPEGRIHGFLVTPKAGARHQRRWQARIDKALRRAGLV